MGQCKCGSYAINPHIHGREPNTDLHLCDVCYWRERAQAALEHRESSQSEMVMMPVTPVITTEMKAALIGEFSWQEEAPYYDDDGELHDDYVATHTVPWGICKDIFKRFYAMAVTAAKEPS